MRFIDLFAGIGGFRRGMELAGHECVGFCEYDDFATASYTSMHLITEEQREYLRNMNKRKRQKEILKGEYKNGEWYAKDIKEVTGNDMPEAECWCFGAPCQSFSIAGKRAGLKGESGLVREVFRLLWEKREEDRPEWLAYENVRGMWSSNRGFDYLAILTEMDKLGYDAEWLLCNSKDYGIPQNRERVYTVGHLRRCGGREIFPVEGADGKNRVSINQIGHGPHISAVPEFPVPVECKTAGIDVVCSKKPPEAKRFGQRDDVWGAKGISGCLTASEYKDPHRVAIPIRNGTKKGYMMAHEGDSINYSFLSSKERRGRVGVQVAQTLDTACNQGIFVQVTDELCVYAIWYERYQSYIAIRKLTPKECFRLQGWSWKCEDDRYFDRAEFVNSDSQLYKQAGNGVSVPVVEAIAERLF
ncbi:MAG: DNA (cytosine-5-)-methyltransferase [Lachnospiraceae bacterium]|nr:DNA (cytosine-5-)-methyltransferase [Lachnospiraceae bacterium]